MSRAVLRRYVWFGYWAVFAGFTVYAAQFPGYVPRPEEVPYPWIAVFFVWIVLAVLLGILYAIVRPTTFQYQWGRIVGALAYVAVLFGAGLATFVTDMPGYYYVPAVFSFVTMLAVLALALVATLTELLRRIKHAG